MSLVTQIAGNMSLVTEVRATPPASAELVVMGVLGTTLSASSPSVVTTINTGFEGPAGPSGAGYNHPQPGAQTVWTIAHNLGYRPAVQSFNVGGAEILGDVLHLSQNTLQITFVQPTAGFARLN